MDEYQQSYLLIKSDNQTVTQNNATLVPDAGMISATAVALTIRGVVYTAESGGTSALGGATVVVYDGTGTALATTTTETTGPTTGSYTVAFNGEQGVAYDLTVSASGYQSKTTPVTFTDTFEKEVTVSLDNAATTHSIYGNVVDTATGTGLAGAHITITDGTTVIVSVTTMADGSYLAYDSFAVGSTYTVTVTKLGYTGDTSTVTMTDVAGVRQDFSLAVDGSNYTTIIGRVIVNGSSPAVGVANALVSLYEVDTGTGAENLVATVLSDTNGSYTFTNVVANKTYIVRAIKVELRV